MSAPAVAALLPDSADSYVSVEEARAYAKTRGVITTAGGGFEGFQAGGYLTVNVGTGEALGVGVPWVKPPWTMYRIVSVSSDEMTLESC